MSEFVWVTMFHPETEGVAEVTEDAFNAVWAPKGWKLVEKASADLINLSRARLQEIAAERGVDISQARTKADVVTLLKQEA